jgi:hypothetical protein
VPRDSLKTSDDVHSEVQAEDRGFGIVLKHLIQEFCGGFVRSLSVNMREARLEPVNSKAAQ